MLFFSHLSFTRVYFNLQSSTSLISGMFSSSIGQSPASAFQFHINLPVHNPFISHLLFSLLNYLLVDHLLFIQPSSNQSSASYLLVSPSFVSYLLISLVSLSQSLIFKLICSSSSVASASHLRFSLSCY